MFGIGFQELLVIMVVALIVLGPKRLPEVARSLGKFYRELTSSINEVKSSVVSDLSSIKDIEKEKISLDETKTEKKDTFEKEFEAHIKNKKEDIQPQREVISFKKEVKDEQKS